jgi:hypothetical protein
MCAVWIEVRCDSMESRKCYSGQNNGPMVLVRQGGVSSAVKRLTATAKKQGWVAFKDADGLVALFCPECSPKK